MEVEPASTDRLLPGDNPQAYIPGDRRRALARGESLPPLARGSALFVDISGFTPLTEALATELGGRRGAEELTATLDRVFSALLERLHHWRGSVLYFSGDAVTAWLDGDDGGRAVACALQMQEVMAEVGLVTTPAGSRVRLAVKVAVASGSVHRFVVGDPSVQLIDVLAGRLTDALAAAEQVAQPGEVVVDAAALGALGERVRLAAERPGAAGRVGVVASLVGPPRDPGPPPPPPDLDDDLVRPWLLPPVWERMAAGRGELLAELRPAVPVFLRFGGLDFEEDPSAPERLDAFVRRTQRVFARHGGFVLQLTIGDKGAYLYAVFGSPLAHEDDPARACAAALDLRDDPEPMTVTGLQVGIATGRLRSGTYGHRQRRTFCCLGDAVNLAARLMARAPEGGIWVHGDVAVATRDRFSWDPLDPLTVKGKTQPVEVRALRARTRGAQREGGTSAPLVGRQQELALLRDRWQRAAHGDGQVAVVRAEAGTGKSRLVAELVTGLRAEDVPVARGEASPVATAAGYSAWRDLWADLLGLDLETAGLREVSSAVARLDARLVGRAPLLGAVLGLPLPDSDLTAPFDGELRKTSLEDLLGRLLRARGRLGPLALVVEDCHWLDPLSRDLLAVLARAAADSPVLLVLTSRPDGTPRAGLPVGARAVSDMALEALDEPAARALAAARHRSVTGLGASAEVVDLVVTRAEGNPFYLEQLVDYLAAHTHADGLDVDALDLPPGVHSLVLSRIDAQQEGPRRAVRVASVVGRAFGTSLVTRAHPDLGTEDAVHQDLLTMAGTRLVALEDPAARLFAFGHAVTRDVAYDSLPHQVRTVLHTRVGDALEQEPDGPRRHLDLLVHHYTRGDDVPRQRRYLLAAAEVARAGYALAAAVAHLRQALPLVEPDARVGVLLSLAEALELQGDWVAAEDAVQQSLVAAVDVGDAAGEARSRVALAELARKQGRYADAAAGLDTAEAAFVALGDEAGEARVLHLRGTLASQQGDPAAARGAYEASLALRDRLGDEAGVAAMLTNLALVAEDEGNLETAERTGLDALARRRALGDRRAESVSLTNMGMLATARGDLTLALTRFQEAQALAEEVGDPWVVAVGHHNLGNTARDLRRLADVADHLQAALDAYAERDDLWSLAHLFEDVALWVLVRDGDHDADAVQLLAAAGRLRDDIGAPRFPPTEAAIAAALARARTRIPATAWAAAEAAGRETDVAAATTRCAALLAVAPRG